MESTQTTLEKSHPEKKGWLLKWANYMTGFQRRWFVLSNGTLSYYRNQDEINEKCRGTIPLHSAQINTIDDCIFTVSNGGTLNFHIKAANMDELQSWVSALSLAKSSIIGGIESEEEEEEKNTSIMVPSTSASVELDFEKEGWLCKNGNLFVGFEQFWFVLSNGVLRYYHNRIEKNPKWNIISLHNAQINTINFRDFSISFYIHEVPMIFRATSAEEREAWVTALKSSQAKAIGCLKSEGEEEKLSKPKSEKLNSKKEGWLFKHINLWTGYEQRYFVISNGVLNYCHNRIEKDPKWKTISLHGAQINTIDFCRFSISTNSDTQPLFFRATSSEEREAWENALKLAQANPTGAPESENEVNKTAQQVISNQEINIVINDLTECLEKLRTCNDGITKHGTALQQALTDLDTNDYQTLTSRTKNINESAKSFLISSDAMLKASNDYLRTAESQDHSWLQMLQQEREQRQLLEKLVKQLTNQQ